MVPAAHSLRTVAFGPAMPGWGSWEWIGLDLHKELSRSFHATIYDYTAVPKADVVVVVKHAPARDWLEAVRARSAVIYCPVDFYGSAAAIDADSPWLRRCARIVVHSLELRKYFEPYAIVEYLDHHLKFATPMRETYLDGDYVLWVGARSNLPPVVAWLAANPLPCPLHLVTNFEAPDRPITKASLGVNGDVHVHDWSAEVQRALMAGARGALDIKGEDFRGRHKPPAKAFDFIASGLPLTMNPDSCVVSHLARMGFDVAAPRDRERWFSREYFLETQRFGRAVRELLSLERVGRRCRRILEEVLAEKDRR